MVKLVNIDKLVQKYKESENPAESELIKALRAIYKKLWYVRDVNANLDLDEIELTVLMGKAIPFLD